MVYYDSHDTDPLSAAPSIQNTADCNKAQKLLRF